MPVVSEQVHPLGLDFANQRRAYILRTVGKLPYEEIARRLVNLQGKAPCWTLVRRVCEEFSTKKGRRVSKYANSGRPAPSY